MAKKQLDGYSFEEAQQIMKEYIDESAERLRKRLREEWAKQAKADKKRIYA